MIKLFEQSNIFTVVASFNAQILVAAPAILLVINRRFYKNWILLSILAGSVVVWWSTFFPPSTLLENSSEVEKNIWNSNILLVLPILSGLFISSIAVLPAFFFKKNIR